MIKIRQLQETEILSKTIDIFISSSGFESRAILQAKKFSKISKEKISLAFNNEMDDEVRIDNDKFYKKNKFSLPIIDGEESNNSCLKDIICKIKLLSESKEHIIVYMDYSCMTKNWYSFLLYSLYHMPKNENITIYLGYSHARFVPFDGNNTLNKVVSPLFGFCDLSVPSKPTALIIGMGNEPNRIYGLKEYFDASPYLFYSDKSYNERYCEEVSKLNENIIDEINPNNIFRFPIHDMIYTNYVLESLCVTLLKDYRVILAPCGPKPFAVLCLINSINHEDSLEVWRISAGSKMNKIDRKPTGLVSYIELIINK